MSLLYKYFDLCGIAALRKMSLLASNPSFFNDPFEIRPCFDQERHNFFAKSHEEFHARFGIPNSLIACGTMVGVPTENAVDFGEQLNKRFRDEMGNRFRVCCFSRTPHNVLMWGHYATSHQGFVLGLDVSKNDFAPSLRTDGFEINYTTDRSGLKLPLAYYGVHSVENYDLHGNVVNNPNEEIASDCGLVIPFSEYFRKIESARISTLTTKDINWAYEQEVRLIYDLPKHGKNLKHEGERHLIPIPPASVRKIVFGLRTPLKIVKEVVELLQSGKIGTPDLFYAGCHPFRYEIQNHAAPTPEYLLQYYEADRLTL
jgi:hypothetical protein